MSVDWNAVRSEFPAVENWTYLNTATYGQLPRRGVERIHQHLQRRDELACADFMSWFDDMDGIRELCARLICCSPEDIAYVPNASVALATLLNGIDWQPGDSVVTLTSEFPNNIYAPGVLARRGVEFIETHWEKFYESIAPRTRLVAISTVSYVTGFAPPLEEIAAFLRERGILLYVDGTQSVGALQFDVSRVRPDMMAVHGYKWLNSPDSAGFMYVSPALRAHLDPLVVGWRSHRDWRNVDNLHHGTPQFSDTAEKYEAGILPVAALYAMAGSLELVLEIGPEAIEHRVMELANHVREAARDLGGTPVAVNSQIVAIHFEGLDPSLLARELKEKRVIVAARHGLLRVSPHYYNNEADIDRFRTVLKSLL